MGLLGQQLEASAARQGSASQPAGADAWRSPGGTLAAQVEAAATVQGVPLQVGAGGYWTQGKIAFWAWVVFLGVVGYVWDTRLASVWDDWCLARRQAARQQGRKFTLQENVDDFVALLLQRVGNGIGPSEQPAPFGTPAGTPLGAFSSGTARPADPLAGPDSNGTSGKGDNKHTQLPV